MLSNPTSVRVPIRNSQLTTLSRCCIWSTDESSSIGAGSNNAAIISISNYLKRGQPRTAALGWKSRLVWHSKGVPCSANQGFTPTWQQNTPPLAAAGARNSRFDTTIRTLHLIDIYIFLAIGWGTRLLVNQSLSLQLLQNIGQLMWLSLNTFVQR